MKSIPVRLDIGLMLLRLVLAYSLFSSAFDGVVSSFWYTGTVPLEVRQAYILCGAVAALCLASGIFTRTVSLATFLWILFSEFQGYNPHSSYYVSFYALQASTFLVLFFTGPGKYVVRLKFLEKRPLSHSEPNQA